MMTAAPGAQNRLVLALDTSSNVAGVAVFESRGDAHIVLLASRQHVVTGTQTRMLLALVEQLLDEVGGRPADLGAVVVGTGPGTFTGVRIGVASARAAALALDVPIVGVSSLSALAAAAVDRGLAEGVGVIVPVVDARRGQVFAEVYRRAENRENREKPGRADVDGVAFEGQWTRQGGPFVVSPDDFDSAVAERDPGQGGDRQAGERLLTGHVGLLPAAIGGGRAPAEVEAGYLVRGQSHIGDSGIGDSGLLEGRGMVEWLTGAVSMGRRASDLGRPGVLGTPEAVRPTYVRTPDADRHIKRMRDPWRT